MEGNPSLEGPGEYEQVVPTVWDQPKHGLRVVESVGRKDSRSVTGSELRHRYGWGGKKLLVLLQQEGLHLSLPTVNRIIRRQGLVRAKASTAPL